MLDGLHVGAISCDECTSILRNERIRYIWAYNIGHFGTLRIIRRCNFIRMDKYNYFIY